MDVNALPILPSDLRLERVIDAMRADPHLGGSNVAGRILVTRPIDCTTSHDRAKASTPIPDIRTVVVREIRLVDVW